jgi:hypothetical protein
VQRVRLEHPGQQEHGLVRSPIRNGRCEPDQYRPVRLPQVLPAGGQPVRGRQVGQQIAAVGLRRRAQGGLVTGDQGARDQFLEPQYVDRYRARLVEHDQLVLDGQQPIRATGRAGQRAPRHVQRLVQVPGRGDRLQIGPQPLEHLLAVPSLARRERQHRHHGPGLAQPPLPGIHRRAVDPHAERPEKLDVHFSAGELHGDHYSRYGGGPETVCRETVCANQPTCTRGRLDRSGSARRSTSLVIGAISPTPKNRKRSRLDTGLPSVHSK